jgi:hypothetical protein
VLLLRDVGYHDDMGRRVDRLRVKRVGVKAIARTILMLGAVWITGASINVRRHGCAPSTAPIPRKGGEGICAVNCSNPHVYPSTGQTIPVLLLLPWTLCWPDSAPSPAEITAPNLASAQNYLVCGDARPPSQPQDPKTADPGQLRLTRSAHSGVALSRRHGEDISPPFLFTIFQPSFDGSSAWHREGLVLEVQSSAFRVCALSLRRATHGGGGMMNHKDSKEGKRRREEGGMTAAILGSGDYLPEAASCPQYNRGLETAVHKSDCEGCKVPLVMAGLYLVWVCEPRLAQKHAVGAISFSS